MKKMKCAISMNRKKKERRSCLHCLLDEDSEMCEDCIEMIDEGGNEHDFV